MPRSSTSLTIKCAASTVPAVVISFRTVMQSGCTKMAVFSILLATSGNAAGGAADYWHPPAKAVGNVSTQPLWRRVARRAHFMMQEHKYERAIYYYQKAIELLEHDQPKGEIALDLRLAIAENLRQQKLYSQAQAELDAIAQALQGRELLDPLLWARYWRRRAEVQFNQGLGTAGVASFHRMLAVIARHFDVLSPHRVNDWSLLVRLMEQHQLWENLIAELHTVAATYGSLDKAPQKLKVACADAQVAMHHAQDELLRQGKLDTAAKIIETLSKFGEQPLVNILRWSAWAQAAVEHDKSKLPIAVKHIEDLLSQLPPPPNDHEAEIEIQSRANLIFLYGLVKARPQLIEAQWDKISRLGTGRAGMTPPGTAVVVQANKLKTDHIQALIKILSKSSEMRMKKEAFDEETQKELLQLINLTHYPELVRLKLTGNDVLRTHFMSRFQSSAWYGRKGRLPEAEKCLNSIAKEAIASMPVAHDMLCQRYLRFATRYRERGDLESARRLFAGAESHYALMKSHPPDLVKEMSAMRSSLEAKAP